MFLLIVDISMQAMILFCSVSELGNVFSDICLYIIV